MEDLYKYENELYAKGLEYIGGVDEVGRGPLIGSVVAACVVLPLLWVLLLLSFYLITLRNMTFQYLPFIE